MRLNIQYLTHLEIDKQKWDHAIKSSFNGQLHASSWYLDIVCEQWDALIEGDYQRIMPLPWRKIYGKQILYHPEFCAALGIFSIDKLDADIVSQFVGAIPRKFKFIELFLNKFNKFENPQFQISRKLTSELDLICEYPRLFESFSQQTQDILTDLAQEQFTIQRKISIKNFISFYISNKTYANEIEKSKTESLLTTLLTALSKYGVGESIAIHSTDSSIIASAFFILHQNKATLLLLASSKISASYLMIDEFIRTYTMKNITLEFPHPETTDEQTIFEAFSAINTNSMLVTKNKIPFYLRPFITKQ